MKGNRILGGLAALLLAAPAGAQTPVDSALVDQFLLDFSVPDMPAFKALDVEPSNLLRPSEVKKFAAMISPFYSNGRGVIPKNIALEVAPWKLVSSRWTLADYANDGWKRFRYNSAFSLGALQDSGQLSSRAALGYRVSFLSKDADLYRSQAVRDFVFQSQEKAQRATVQLNTWWLTSVKKLRGPAAIAYREEHADEFSTFLAGARVYLAQNPDTAAQRALNDLIAVLDPKGTMSDAALNTALGDSRKQLDALISAFIADYKKRYWNASRADVAIALVGAAGDTLVRDLSFSSLSAWASYAIRLGDNQQLVIGGNGVLPRSAAGPDSLRINLAGSLRLYYGTQDVRGFVETQYKYRRFERLDRSLLVNLGAEFRVGQSFWVMASTGLNNYLQTGDPFSQLVSNLDLRYAFNQPRR